VINGSKHYKKGDLLLPLPSETITIPVNIANPYGPLHGEFGGLGWD